MSKNKKAKSTKVRRIATKQPGVYKNTSTNKYDIKYCYTQVNPMTSQKEYKQKWIYGINSYTVAVKKLAEMKGNKFRPNSDEITLEQAYALWEEKAVANNMSPMTFRNTKQQFGMIQRFWSPNLAIIQITEENYLRLIAQCREYGYSEETIWNINACLRKLINIAYKNHYITENPIDFWDSPRIKTGANRHVISVDDFAKLDSYFAENEFYRAGENHYPKYHFLVNLLYYTGMRIGEAIALTYEDFEIYAKTPRGKVKYMRVSITKSYNSAYKLLKGTKSDKSRKIPLPEKVIMLFNEIKEEHLRQEGSLEDQIFNWEHNACTVMIKKACKRSNIREYTCHDFRHTYISNLIRQGVPIPVIEAVTGDTQETIFKRYAHMFEGDEDMVLNAMANL